MADQTQTLGTHRRWIPAFHFFTLPVLLINVVLVVVNFVRDPRLASGWAVLVALALLIGIVLSRNMPLRGPLGAPSASRFARAHWRLDGRSVHWPPIRARR